MKYTEIENIKIFTKKLFIDDAFDFFQAAEAEFDTLFSVTIDGHYNEGFLTDEEKTSPAHSEGIVSWKALKPLCYEIIKGKKLPLRFKIVLKLPESKVPIFIKDLGEEYKPESVAALFLNIKYENGKLDCTTGTSMKEFTMDKTIEQLWDEKISKYLLDIQN